MRFIVLIAAVVSFGAAFASTYAEAQTGTAGHGYQSRTYQENRSANTQSNRK